MKVRIIFMLIIFSLLSSVPFVVAQDILQTGIKAGINIANLSGNDLDNDTDPIIGPSAGIFIEYYLQKYLSIRSEIQYVLKGAKTSLSYFDGIYEQTAKMNYIDIPFVIVGHLHNNLDVYVGPYLGFYLNGTLTDYWNCSDYEMRDKRDIEENTEIKKQEYGFLLGGEYSINRISINVRYSNSLTGFQYDENDNILDIKNTGIQITIGLLFQR